ncbi:MAG: endolytic transglycosylase MltG [bacterium]|nr:endolytic transglycosylase MltG [bacterium]
MKRPRKILVSRLFIVCLLVAVAGLVIFSLPGLLVWKQAQADSAGLPPFPVTVNPNEKSITEDPAVESMFSKDASPLSAAAASLSGVFEMLASVIAASPVYQTLSLNSDRFVSIYPGYRKEEVALAFGKALEWGAKTQVSFLTAATDSPPIPEGRFSPGTYILGFGASQADARSEIRERFDRQILSRYATSTAEIVPLSHALTIASMIERETSNKDEMRLISGIIWNRIFSGMKLQIDATVQYAKATGLPAQAGKNGWWPALRSQDKFIPSLFNTYLHLGLPPSPISNPGVAAVLAALNPKKTSCLFYFHDRLGVFHCSDTYQEHVALLKKYYGQGK